MAITLSSVFTGNLLGTAATAGVANQIGGGALQVYSGTPPAGPNEALSGNGTLAVFTLNSASSQGTPSGGSMNLSFAATSVTATGTGTATCFRVLNAAAAALIQGSVGASGADFNLSSNVITAGDMVAITGTPTISWVVT